MLLLLIYIYYRECGSGDSSLHVSAVGLRLPVLGCITVLQRRAAYLKGGASRNLAGGRKPGDCSREPSWAGEGLGCACGVLPTVASEGMLAGAAEGTLPRMGRILVTICTMRKQKTTAVSSNLKLLR